MSHGHREYSQEKLFPSKSPCHNRSDSTHPFVTLIEIVMAPVLVAGERSEEGTYEAYQQLAWNQPACQTCIWEPRHRKEER